MGGGGIQRLPGGRADLDRGGLLPSGSQPGRVPVPQTPLSLPLLTVLSDFTEHIVDFYHPLLLYVVPWAQGTLVGTERPGEINSQTQRGPACVSTAVGEEDARMAWDPLPRHAVAWP